MPPVLTNFTILFARTQALHESIGMTTGPVSRWYFAYGSNMNPDRVAQRGLAFRKVRHGWLPGFGLRFNKQSRDHPECGHANLVFAPGETAEGLLYELTDDRMILRMDPFERAPINYSRECIWVETRDEPIASWTYFANPAVLREGLAPSREYLDHLLVGQHYLSVGYFRQLAATPIARAPQA